ncbi:hypothetical protein [Nocardia sp. alder85J]|uniref:hypothetical protein n=1 Tax=Nocardia sp. alder85J TaxID=2862949 RepID=UPI001CD81863|nr:hypothetical protein [Nocardia sp. alder85J]MCX4092989.1 hypothetical protein [Nocardia sp. alder85J]
MARIREVLRCLPGQNALVRGYYECDCGRGHWCLTEGGGAAMPALPADCLGVEWVLHHLVPRPPLDLAHR